MPQIFLKLLKNSVRSSQVKYSVAITTTTCVMLERDMMVADYKNRSRHMCSTNAEPTNVETAGIMSYRRLAVFVK
jgi:hypothetical protein